MLRLVQGTFASSRKLLADPQGASASRSSHPAEVYDEAEEAVASDEEEEKEEEGEQFEGGDEEAPQEELEEEEEEEEKEEAPTSDPEEKPKQMAPRPTQAPAFGPSASRSSRPVSPSRRPTKRART